MKAVLITGNKKFIQNKIARDYYKEITDYLEERGVEVTVDPGDDYTCPPKADFYVAHSKGVSRIRCFERTPQLKNFLMFGDKDGYIHPVDKEWQENNPPGSGSRPPKEHFEFTVEQKGAIDRKINELSRMPVNVSRQSPSSNGRPKPI